jgi:hypothetical protein
MSWKTEELGLNFSICYRVHTGSGAHSASYLWGEADRMLHHLHLLLKLRSRELNQAKEQLYFILCLLYWHSSKMNVSGNEAWHNHKTGYLIFLLHWRVAKMQYACLKLLVYISFFFATYMVLNTYTEIWKCADVDTPLLHKIIGLTFSF